MPLRRSQLLTGLIVPLLLSCRPSAQTDAAALMRERLGISVLTLNLRDIYNVPDLAAPAGATWRVRYARIVPDLRAAGVIPDIVALQEAPGYWICPTNARRLPDYAAIDVLADDLESLAGERYRVAYLIAQPEHGSDGRGFLGADPSGLCSVRGGRALLYRPSRLRNVITTVPTGESPAAEDAAPPLGRSYVATSLSACAPAADRRDIVADIDGPLVATARCAARVPAGYAWTRAVEVRRRDADNSPTTRISQGAVFSRLELVQEPGNFVHIYNVHRVWDTENDPGNPPPGGYQPTLDTDPINISQLVRDLEARYTSPANPTLYPPILVGDFNLGIGTPPTPPALLQAFPRFERLAWVNDGDIDGALVGGTGMVPAFPARQPAFARSIATFPASAACNTNVAVLWSDHCGVSFRVEPVRE